MSNPDTVRKVTAEEVKMWLGSDCKKSEIIEILADLANWDYEQEVLKEDIINTCDQ